MVYGVFNARKCLLYLAGIRIHDILVVDTELVELPKHVLCGVEVVFVLELDLIFFLLTNLEPFVQRHILVVVDLSFAGNVLPQDHANNGHEVL